MGTKSITIFFAKFFLIYLTLLCLVISLNFLVNIKVLLNEFSIISIIGLAFLLIYLFIISSNMFFFFGKKVSGNYKSILLFNSIFSIISGFSLRTGNWLIANNLGADISIILLKDNTNWRYLLHFNILDFVVKYQHEPIGDQGWGFQINLIMLAIGIFLFICYKKNTFSMSNKKDAYVNTSNT